MAIDDNNIFSHGSRWLRADFHLHTRADKEFSYSGDDEYYLSNYVDALEKERKDMIVELEMLKEEHAEIEMKLTLLEDKKDSGKSGGGESQVSSTGRAAMAAEFSGGMEAFLVISQSPDV